MASWLVSKLQHSYSKTWALYELSDCVIVFALQGGKATIYDGPGKSQNAC